MLTSLNIRNLLIIEELSLDFQAGLNVLTGETGAGKSILLDALGAVLGWRGRADLVREGAEQGDVTAVFHLSDDHPARAVLAESGIDVEDGELVLRRVVTAAGRKSAFVNDRRTSGELLRQLSDLLVELHGQHDDRGLLNPRGHRSLLDAFGDLSARSAKCRASWRKWSALQDEIEQARAQMLALRDEEDFLRHAVDELAKLDPQPGEDAKLDQERRLMQSAEKIVEDVARAEAALGRDAAEGRLADALRWLEDAAGGAGDRMDEAVAAVGRALSELADAQAHVANLLQQLAFRPSDLELCEERLFAIRALARKYDVLPDDLGQKAVELRAQLARLDASDTDLAELELACKAAQDQYDADAKALSEARRTSAAKLDRAMKAELTPLKMERARFETVLTPADPGPEGIDQVTFMVATNPGAPAGALDKIASGGELSRFLLALKVCLTADQTGLVMIFDEIDRGVGGATADAVGRRLADLAANGQVLVVTHSPQVAARGSHHWQVSKAVKGGKTISHVAALAEPDRIDEIARMLSGDRITTEARSAAKALLDA